MPYGITFRAEVCNGKTCRFIIKSFKRVATLYTLTVVDAFRQ